MAVPGTFRDIPRLRANRPALAELEDGLPPAPSVICRRSVWTQGGLEARLADTLEEIRAAQRLRYRVFFEEHSIIAGTAPALPRDEDEFDSVCDHVIVLDHDTEGRSPSVVGTYRLLRHDVAQRHFGFYTTREFDISPLLRMPGRRLLELGRSCVLRPYRGRRVIGLLWQAIWTYAQAHHTDVMFGCGSLEGIDPARLALPLSFLHHHALAPHEWRTTAWPQLRAPAPLLPPETMTVRAAMRTLPPLIKGYLRIGAFVGDGAVIDHQFGTTDVCIVLPVRRIGSRYLTHFSLDPSDG